ncbi:aminoglycoside phosphotransferase family protein [Streptomyces sp. NPDC051018]|uniref:aminoglycoside phosphotransferase family protein n=1 Tax=Streptomyces sp. NPDC051018 TaxID=3365639 RepID=UPI0037B22273
MPQHVVPDAETVRRLLPPGETDIRSVAEGGEHSTWLVGADRVLRLALDAEGSERQRREIALRDAVRPYLPVAVPESAATGEWADGLTYTLDTLLPGLSAERRPVSPAGEGELSGFLRGLRAFPVDASLPVEPSRDLRELRERASEAAGRLAADGEFDSALLSRRLHGLPRDQAPPALIHNDLKGEHLLVDESGRMTGVLDWTDAAAGDPAEDIAGLAISVGAAAAVRIAEGAGREPALGVRALWLARCDTLTRLYDRLHEGDDSPLPLLRAQHSRAWELTPLDLS